jgi:hypothetical protein
MIRTRDPRKTRYGYSLEEMAAAAYSDEEDGASGEVDDEEEDLVDEDDQQKQQELPKPTIHDSLYDAHLDDKNEAWVSRKYLQNQPDNPDLHIRVTCAGCFQMLSFCAMTHENDPRLVVAHRVVNCLVVHKKPLQEEQEEQEKEILLPVLCAECGSNAGAFCTSDNLYTFSTSATLASSLPSS